MTISSKSYLLDVWQSSEYASESGLLKYIYIRSKIREKLIVFHRGAGYKNIVHLYAIKDFSSKCEHILRKLEYIY